MAGSFSAAREAYVAARRPERMTGRTEWSGAGSCRATAPPGVARRRSRRCAEPARPGEAAKM